VLLAVKGGLMRGPQVNYILQAAAAVFVREDVTITSFAGWRALRALRLCELCDLCGDRLEIQWCRDCRGIGAPTLPIR
jgi:hypothetical protein